MLWLALNDWNGNTIQLKGLQSAVCILASVYILPQYAVYILHWLKTNA